MYDLPKIWCANRETKKMFPVIRDVKSIFIVLIREIRELTQNK